jgi:hypothetical protein
MGDGWAGEEGFRFGKRLGGKIGGKDESWGFIFYRPFFTGGIS